MSTREDNVVAAAAGNDLAAQSTLKGKIKYMWKAYGYFAIGSYLGLYIVTLSSIYFALDFDVFKASSVGFSPEMAVHKVCEIFEAVTGSQMLPGFIREHPKVGTFAVAWVMTKFTEPLRMGITLAVVPKIATFFKRAQR